MKRCLIIILSILLLICCMSGCSDNHVDVEPEWSDGHLYTVSDIYYDDNDVAYAIAISVMWNTDIVYIGEDIDLNGYDYIEVGDEILCRQYDRNDSNFVHIPDWFYSVQAVNKVR